MGVKRYWLPETEGIGAPWAIRAGDLVFCAGAMAYDPVWGVPESVLPLPGYPNHWSQINRELTFVYENLGRILKDAGASLPDTLKINSYHCCPEDVYEALRLRGDFFGKDAPPPSTLVLVPELPVRDARVAIDLITLAGDAQRPREALVNSTPNAPMPPHERIWGHRIYSKAVRGGGFIFTSGRTNNVIGAASDQASLGKKDSPYEADRSTVSTALILDYLDDVLASFGAGPEHIAKAEIHINDPRLIAGIDEVWYRRFGNEGPARIVVPADFPTENSIMEIEFIAVDPAGPYRVEQIHAPEVPAHFASEPQAVKAGPYLFLSGMLATDYRHGVAPEGRVDPAFPYHQSAAKRQVAYVLEKVEKICAAAGMGLEHLVRRKAIYSDLSEMGAAEAAWRARLPEAIPTTAMRAACDLPVPGCLVLYDLVGYAER